jgi:hypothetical protein
VDVAEVVLKYLVRGRVFRTDSDFLVAMLSIIAGP